jgi:hypothetical protein
VIIMLSVVTGFAIRCRIWNRFGRLNTLHASSLSSVSTSHPSHPSYNKVEDFHIKEYGLTGSIFSHKKSGAKVFNLFCFFLNFPLSLLFFLFYFLSSSFSVGSLCHCTR